MRRSAEERAAPRVAIVGAGFSGVALGILLREAGFHSFTIYEKGERVGGTWRDNTYPGAACDVPSYLYSYSFDPKLDWKKRFSDQADILAYIERCARDHGVLPHVELGAEVREARFDEGAGRWTLELGDGRRAEAEVLVAACGQLSRPKLPDLPGRDAFEGAAFHSARWDHGRRLSGAHVAVVGNGASAIQLVPHVAREAARVVVFQRSANWIVEKPDGEYPEVVHRLFRAAPWAARAYRASIYLRLEARFPVFRTAGSAYRRLVEWDARRYLREQVRDPALRAALTPDYPLGCKRVLISNDWYATLQLPHVELVTAPITRVDAKGLSTDDGRRFDVDTLVYATGFESTRFLSPMKVVGRAGEPLADAWARGAEAYLGMAVPGFPSLFLMYGPNTNLGHNSIVFMIERQARYIVACVRALEERQARFLEVRADAMERFRDRMDAEAQKTVWVAGCDSWYKTDDGRLTNNWPSSTVQYFARTFRPRLADFHVVP